MQRIIEVQTADRILRMPQSGLLLPSGPNDQQRLAGLEKMLTALGIARKELLGQQGLKVYSAALASEFADDTDIRTLFNRMMITPRAEYEAAMPSLPDLLGMVRRVRDERVWAEKRAEREAKERKEAEDFERRKREQPESFVTMAEVMQDWARKQQQPVDDDADRKYRIAAELRAAHARPAQEVA